MPVSGFYFIKGVSSISSFLRYLAEPVHLTQTSRIIPFSLNLFPPLSYARRVITNKICAAIVILYLTNLCSYCFSDKLPRASTE
jgi:hypothetical protein